jgi:hypothetical protein
MDVGWLFCPTVCLRQSSLSARLLKLINVRGDTKKYLAIVKMVLRTLPRL